MKITSTTAIAICAVVCLGALAFLIPNHDHLFQRLLTDDEADSASKPIGVVESTARNAVITALTARSLQLCHDNNWSQESVDVLNGFLRTTGDLEPITAEILRQADTIPPAPRVTILATLVHRAIATGNLSLAEAMQRQLRAAEGPFIPNLVRQDVTF